MIALPTVNQTSFPDSFFTGPPVNGSHAGFLQVISYAPLTVTENDGSPSSSSFVLMALSSSGSSGCSVYRIH